MIALAWHTVRARKAGLIGTFIALSLGVALLSAMALTLVSSVGGATPPPRWFTTPDVVVAGTDSMTVVSGSGDDRETETMRAYRSRGVPTDLPSRLSTVDAEVVLDYAGPATAEGAPGDTVHSWSAASLHAYSWVAGGPPVAADDIVLSAPTEHRPGDRVVVRTVLGAQRYTVCGVLRGGAPAALFTTDAVAVQLANGRLDAVALTARPGGSASAPSAHAGGSVAAPAGGSGGAGAAPTGGSGGSVDAPAGGSGGAGAALAGAVRAVTSGLPVRVLTGNDRRLAEPDPDGDKLVVATALLGTTSGLAGFVSIFVVAGTFAYAVAARRREFGLLRTAGATPRQVRRLVLGEALAVGVAASAAGGAFGTLLAPLFAHWLARSGFAPDSFTAHFVFWPVAAAFGVGLLVALMGAWLAARRAGRVRPVEALRDAAVDRRPMTVARWIVGLLAFGGAVPVVAVLTSVHSGDAAALIIPVAMLLVIGCAMFAPLVIPPLVWLFTLPLAASRGAVGMLARHGARAAVRRTAATAAPILVTLGISGAMLAGTATILHATQSSAADRTVADALVAPAGTAGLADATVAALRTVPGVTAAVPVTDSPVYVREDGSPDEWTGRYTTGTDLAGVLNLPLVAGDLADLTGTGTVAVPAGSWHLGDTAALWLGDSTPVRLRVVAVFEDQLDLEQTVLLPWGLRAAHSVPLATEVYLRLAPGASLAPVSATATEGGGAVIRTSAYLSAAGAEQERDNQLALTAVLGMALLYTGIAIANTLVMATNDRACDLATLRLSGATPGQILRMIAVEAVIVTGIGVLLAGVVTGVAVEGMHRALAGVAPHAGIVVPWGILGGIAVACLVTALGASLIPAALLLRRRA